MIGASLAEALSKLDPLNDNHWTQDGLPRLDTLKMLTADQTLTRERVAEQFPDFKRSQIGQKTIVLNPVVIQAPILDPVVIVTKGDGDGETHAEKDAGETPVENAKELLDELQEAQTVLDALERDYNIAKENYEYQLKRVDEIIRSREKDEKPAVATQISIMQYLETQKQVLQDRQRKLEIIKGSGLDLKLLATDLRAPIDLPKTKRR